jgi:hypothetical protein
MNSNPQTIVMLNVSGGDLTDAECSQMANFCAMQLAGDLANDWNLGPWNVVFTTNIADMVAGVIPFYFLKNSDQAGDLGYHANDPNGNAYIRAFTSPTLTNGGSKFNGSNSILVTASHECCEAAKDPNCETYVGMPDGLHFPHQKADGTTEVITTSNSLMAFEMSDPVEAFSYEIQLATGEKGSVTDYLRPAYFDAEAKGPFDRCGALNAPFSLGTQSYAILKLVDGTDIQSFSRLYPEWKLPLKALPSARAAKRLSRFSTHHSHFKK